MINNTTNDKSETIANITADTYFSQEYLPYYAFDRNITTSCVLKLMQYFHIICIMNLQMVKKEFKFTCYNYSFSIYADVAIGDV